MLNNLYNMLNFVGLSAPVENITQFDSLVTSRMSFGHIFEEFMGTNSISIFGSTSHVGFLELTFFIFAIASILSGFFVIISVNPMHSVFALVLTFVNVSILLLFLGIEFLAFLFMIVYVGAIAILFLFVVMMLNIRIVELIENTTRYVPIGLIVGLVFLIELSASQIFSQTNAPLGHLTSSDVSLLTNAREVSSFGPEGLSSTSSVGTLLEYSQRGHLVLAGTIDLQQNAISADIKNATSTFFNSTNLRSLGNVLYTEYFIYFLVSSLVLLIAMIGAILLTLHHEKGVKRQDIYSQICEASDISKAPGGDASHIRLRHYAQ